MDHKTDGNHESTDADRFRINDLPLELRLEIYQHVITDSLDNSVASFVRPIAIPDFYEWIDRPLLSAKRLKLLECSFPEVGLMNPRLLALSSGILYVDSPNIAWMPIAQRLGLRKVLLNTQSWANTRPHTHLSTLCTLGHGDPAGRISVMVVSRNFSLAELERSQSWTLLRVEDAGTTNCMFAHLRGVWTTKGLMEVRSGEVLGRGEWIEGLRIMNGTGH